MERIAALLERERELLDVLLFKLVETRLILESGDTRYLARSTREVERARSRLRELDLVRATTVARHDPGASLRALAARSPEPWPGILRDHHESLARLVAEIEMTAHQNAGHARRGLDALRATRVAVPVGAGDVADRFRRDDDLVRLARGAAFETVMGTAARLHMPDLLAFLQ